MSFRWSPIAASEPVFLPVAIDLGLITGVKNITDWIKVSNGLVVEFDLVSLDPAWPCGDTGNLVLKWEKALDGRCAHAVLKVGMKLFAVARARAYYITADKDDQDDWYVLGDPLVASIIRRNLLHDKLISGRVIACHLEGWPLNRIVWAAGPHADKAEKLGMRELERSEVLGAAPRTLLKFAAHSLRTSGERKLKTGLFCFDEADLPRLTTTAGEVSTGTLALRGEGNEIIAHATRAAAPNWTKNVAFSGTLPADKNRAEQSAKKHVYPFSTKRSKS